MEDGWPTPPSLPAPGPRPITLRRPFVGTVQIHINLMNTQALALWSEYIHGKFNKGTW